MYFGYHYQQPLFEFSLPHSITHLTFYTSYRHKTIDKIPNSVTVLEFISKNSPLEPYELIRTVPESVLELYIGKASYLNTGLEQDIDDKPVYKRIIVPQSIQKIVIDGILYCGDKDDLTKYFTVYNPNTILIKSAIE